MSFDIRQHINFDSKGRADCPACKPGKSLTVTLSGEHEGAYKCFRGCSPAEIRAALGATKATTVAPPRDIPKNVLVTPAKVKAAHTKLVENSTHALKWLHDRGITSEMIEHYRLGVVRAKAGKKHLPAIAIPIAAGETHFFQKKRIAPWLEEKPEDYKPWSQYGIPATVYITHQPANPTTTWLCEGEWDAIALGWAVKHSDFGDRVQVACFTCGAGNVPSSEELLKLTSDVVILYDRDEPGTKGTNKLAGKLGKARVATVPTGSGDVPKGWDVSDALNAGLQAELFQAATDAPPWQPPKRNNPLRDRLITNDELLARAPDYTDWLIDDLLTADELFVLAASPRAGKSLMALTLAQAVASGGKFLGRPATQGTVIYIRCEDSETKTKEREIKQGWGEGLPVYWLDKFKLSELDHLEEVVEELDAKLVVFDTLSRIRDASVNESSAEMSQLLEPIQDLCQRQCCTGLLVHHTNKINLENAADTNNVFETIRGSSAIRATCRGSLVIAADDRCYRLVAENGWGKLDLQILLDANTLQWRLLGNWVGPDVDLSQKDRVLNYLNQVGSAQLNSIAEATNLPKRSLYEVLKRLQADDIVEKRGERRSAVYVRKGIQQIQQLNTLLNSETPDGETDTGVIQQNNLLGGTSEKVIISDESDQNFDHFSEKGVPPTNPETVEKLPKPPPDKGYGIQQQFNTIQQADSTAAGKTAVWRYWSEVDTFVEVIQQTPHYCRVYLPGQGLRSAKPEDLFETAPGGEEECQ